MFDRYTDNARIAMGYALQAAESLEHTAIRPEHILLGLLRVKRRDR